MRVFPGGSDGKECAYKAGDLGSIPGSGRSPGEGNGNPFQYSSLENSTDRGYSPWDQTEKDKYPTYIWNLKKKQKQMSKIKTVLQIQRTPRREKRIDKGDEEEQTCSNAVNKS